MSNYQFPFAAYVNANYVHQLPCKRIFISLVLLVLQACSHTANTISISPQPLGSKPITAINVLVIPGTFVGKPEQSEALSKNGFSQGSYQKNLANAIVEAFPVNGVTIKSVDLSKPRYVPDAETPTLTVEFKQLRTTTISSTKYHALDIHTTLYAAGGVTPIWKGQKIVDLRNNNVTHGNFALSILNALVNEKVIDLPKGYAVTPKGSRNYVGE